MNTQGLKDTIEEQISLGSIFEKKDKTTTDVVLAKEDINSNRELIKKSNLSSTEFNLLRDKLVGAELKLQNLTAYERYLLGKFLSVWVSKILDITQELTYFKEKKDYEKLTPYQRELFDNCLFLSKKYSFWSVDVYNFWARSGHSINAYGFKELIKTKIEVLENNNQKEGAKNE